jgi:HlyD family secretion protein
MRARAGIPLALALLLGGCLDDGPKSISGYVEGDFVDLGVPGGGRVVEVAVARGDAVAAGAAVFRLDPAAAAAALRQAEAKRAQAQADTENLLTGKRPEEIAVIAAQRNQAAAQLQLAEQELTRQRGLKGTSAALQQKLDTAAANATEARARVTELEAQLDTARLAARRPEIQAAGHAVAAADAAVAEAQTALADRTGIAPQDARVEDVFFHPGETVGAGAPVVRLLPPGNVIVRAYLGADALARLPQGARAELRCAACGAGAAATVSFVSSEAAYAPPILYSRENAAKLAFLVELRPDAAIAARLRPGQPVEIVPREAAK